MKLNTYELETMSGDKIRIESFNQSQAITIWKSGKPKELFKTIRLIDESKDIKKYNELMDKYSNDKVDKKELKQLKDLIKEIRSQEIYKKFKRKYNSFENHPMEIK